MNLSNRDKNKLRNMLIRLQDLKVCYHIVPETSRQELQNARTESMARQIINEIVFAGWDDYSEFGMNTKQIILKNFYEIYTKIKSAKS